MNNLDLFSFNDLLVRLNSFIDEYANVMDSETLDNISNVLKLIKRKHEDECDKFYELGYTFGRNEAEEEYNLGEDY